MTRRPRRIRHEPPKVWHNPDVVGVRRGDDHEAAPVSTEAPIAGALRRGARDARATKIVAASTEPRDEKEVLLERLLERLSVAEGRAAITKIVAEIEELGLAVPSDHQIANLQLLEHSDEARVKDAIECLQEILEREPPKRATVLDSRLRRIEELAEEAATRKAASELKRRVKALPG